MIDGVYKIDLSNDGGMILDHWWYLACQKSGGAVDICCRFQSNLLECYQKFEIIVQYCISQVIQFSFCAFVPLLRYKYAKRICAFGLSKKLTFCAFGFHRCTMVRFFMDRTGPMAIVYDQDQTDTEKNSKNKTGIEQHLNFL